MKLTICKIFLLILFLISTFNFCTAGLHADSYDTSSSLPYPSESGSGSFSSLNTMPEIMIDAEKYIDLTEGIQLIPSKEIGDLYLSNIGQNERRKSIFQKLNGSILGIPNSGKKGLGLLQTDISIITAFPLPTEKSPLIITPSFSHKRFSRKSADSLDLYNTGVDFRWLFPVIDRKLSFDIATSVLYSGNFEGSTSKAIRYPSHIAAIWNFNPRLKLIIGIAYLDRSDDYNLLPIGGLIWTPNPDINVELLFPIMRITRRLTYFDQWDTNSNKNFTRWIYGAFEIGGSSWNYERNGKNNEINYHDFRFAIGYEHRCNSGTTLGIETGCVIGREIEIKPSPTYKPDTAFFIRLRISI